MAAEASGDWVVVVIFTISSCWRFERDGYLSEILKQGEKLIKERSLDEIGKEIG